MSPVGLTVFLEKDGTGRVVKGSIKPGGILPIEAHVDKENGTNKIEVLGGYAS